MQSLEQLEQRISLCEIQQYQITKEMTKDQEQQALYWYFVKDRDIALKRSLQKNFTKLMTKFPNFPKDLLPLPEA